MSDGRLFILTLRPVPPGEDRLGRDPLYRLRLLLKPVWRDLGFRCEDVREIQGDDVTSRADNDGAAP